MAGSHAVCGGSTSRATGRYGDRFSGRSACASSIGGLCGAVYAAAAEYMPAAAVGFGSVYGAVLFAGASEVVLPAFGWVPSPAKRTAVQHVVGLGGNVVYGMTTEAVRRLLRASG